jgi:phage baseplate assembly protein W
MYGIGPRLPLMKDDIDGHFGLVKNLTDEVQQNLYNLVMTSPGERIMDIDFGVGMRRYLFEPLLPQTEGRIESRIRKQVKKYLPFVQISSIQFSTSAQANLLGVQIIYQAPNNNKNTLILDFTKNN